MCLDLLRYRLHLSCVINMQSDFHVRTGFQVGQFIKFFNLLMFVGALSAHQYSFRYDLVQVVSPPL
jgi:hypothetical protein